MGLQLTISVAFENSLGESRVFLNTDECHVVSSELYLKSHLTPILRKLVNSPKHIKEVLKRKGSITKY